MSPGKRIRSLPVPYAEINNSFHPLLTGTYFKTAAYCCYDVMFGDFITSQESEKRKQYEYIQLSNKIKCSTKLLWMDATFDKDIWDTQFNRYEWWWIIVRVAGEGLRILTCVRHSLPMSSEGSWACHTYCDTWHPLLKVISKEP